MARACELTGKKTIVGNNVSHSKRRTKRSLFANVHVKRFFIPELKRSVKLNVSTRAMRTINKKGLYAFIMELKKQGVNVL